MNERKRFTQKIPPVLSFLGHIICGFPLARWAIVSSLLLLILEYTSISVMIPLAASKESSDNSGSGSGQVSLIWASLIQSFGLQPTLITWIWLFLVLLAFRTLAGYGHALLITFLSKQVHRCLSVDVFHRVLVEEPMAMVYKRSIGHYVSLAGDDTFRAGSLVNTMLQMFTGILSTGAGLVLLYVFSPLAFTAMIGFLGISALFMRFAIQHVLLLNNESVAQSREASTTFLEALNGLRSIRSMGCEPFVQETYGRQMVHYTHLLFQVEAIKAGVKAVPGLLALLIGVITLGPWFNDLVPIEPQTVLAGTMIIVRVFISLGTLMSSAGIFLIDTRAAKDLSELTQGPKTHLEATYVEREATAPIHEGAIKEIELRSVSFSYTTSMPVLADINFKFRAGCVYAVTGPSGAGKSTLADLLLGLLEPSAGEIIQKDKRISAETLRHQVVLVEQQPRIFSASLRDNLSLGLIASDVDINAALEAVDLGDMIRALPAGIYTMLDYQGANLSGGQRQRLSIARALLREPKVLILDEATSAIDPQTRDQIVAKIRARLQSGIIIFITHDETISALADGVLELSAHQVEIAPT